MVGSLQNLGSVGLEPTISVELLACSLQNPNKLVALLAWSQQKLGWKSHVCFQFCAPGTQCLQPACLQPASSLAKSDPAGGSGTLFGSQASARPTHNLGVVGLEPTILVDVLVRSLQK